MINTRFCAIPVRNKRNILGAFQTGFSGIIILLALLFCMVAYIGIDHRLTEKQATDFCNSIEIGHQFDIDDYTKQLEDIGNARRHSLRIDGGTSYLVQFMEFSHFYYSCSFDVKNGIISEKVGVLYKD
jgi:hypothetical protein